MWSAFQILYPLLSATLRIKHGKTNISAFTKREYKLQASVLSQNLSVLISNILFSNWIYQS